jgi:hypothetical protein
MDHSLHFLLIKEPGCIEKVLPFPFGISGWRSNDNTDIVCMLTDLINSRVTFFNKVFKLEEIPRRIPSHAEL